jgi:hypothetical protein
MWYQNRTADGQAIGCRHYNIEEALQECPPYGLTYQEGEGAPKRVFKSVHGSYCYAYAGKEFIVPEELHNLEDN